MQQAAKWHRRAAVQGHDDVQCYLGIIYENGQGVQKNYAEAVKWYRRAADQGVADAQCNLGFMYEDAGGGE